MREFNLSEFRRELPQVVASFTGSADPLYLVKDHGRLAFGTVSPSWVSVISETQQCDQDGALLPKEQMLAIFRRLFVLIETEGQTLSVKQLLTEVVGQARISADFVRLQEAYYSGGDKTVTKR